MKILFCMLFMLLYDSSFFATTLLDIPKDVQKIIYQHVFEEDDAEFLGRLQKESRHNTRKNDINVGDFSFSSDYATGQFKFSTFTDYKHMGVRREKDGATKDIIQRWQTIGEEN